LSSGDLFVVSAPSGTGKTTLIRRLLSDLPGIEFSVSYTTREPREGEREGVDYHFVGRPEFDGMIGREEFLEWAEVHDHRYGTSARLVDEALARDRDVLLDIDSQGAASVRRLRPGAVTIFIMPPDFETLQRRLRDRALETEAERQRRLRNARAEIETYTRYDYVIVNDSIEKALRSLEAVVLARRSLRRRQETLCRGILETFRRG
jgi:guanylate kinase